MAAQRMRHGPPLMPVNLHRAQALLSNTMTSAAVAAHSARSATLRACLSQALKQRTGAQLGGRLQLHTHSTAPSVEPWLNLPQPSHLQTATSAAEWTQQWVAMPCHDRVTAPGVPAAARTHPLMLICRQSTGSAAHHQQHSINDNTHMLTQSEATTSPPPLGLGRTTGGNRVPPASLAGPGSAPVGRHCTVQPLQQTRGRKRLKGLLQRVEVQSCSLLGNTHTGSGCAIPSADCAR